MFFYLHINILSVYFVLRASDWNFNSYWSGFEETESRMWTERTKVRLLRQKLKTSRAHISSTIYE